nr:immunoglobulin light chain junction region [Macaca mulatta]
DYYCQLWDSWTNHYIF